MNREGYSASFVIPTRNRVHEVRSLLRSALAQTVPVEILVMDDGASQPLADMLRDEFPEVRYYGLGTSCGPAFQRNRGIELARCEIVFALDDDTVLRSPRTVEQTLAEFDDPRVGALGIPYVNVRIDGEVRQRAPTPAPGTWVAHAFVGASHAIRRSAFLQVGGYREHFYYMGEEGDLCIRLLNAGYVVRLGTADPIDHLESSRRNLALADYCGRRNDVLFAWHNVPIPFLAMHTAGTVLNGLLSTVRAQNPGRMLLGTIHGFTAVRGRWHERSPVPLRVYLLHRALKKSGPRQLVEVLPQLAPLLDRPLSGSAA